MGMNASPQLWGLQAGKGSAHGWAHKRKGSTMGNGGIMPTYDKARNGTVELLRRSRYERALSRSEVAELAGVSVSTVVRWETFGVTPKMLASRMIGLCRAYGISADQLQDYIEREP